MSYDDELSQKQIKNIKRKVVSFIWETTPRQIIRLALICQIKIPKNLLEKYTSEE
jgi:hypothetical protein